MRNFTVLIDLYKIALQTRLDRVRRKLSTDRQTSTLTPTCLTVSSGVNSKCWMSDIASYRHCLVYAYRISILLLSSLQQPKVKSVMRVATIAYNYNEVVVV